MAVQMKSYPLDVSDRVRLMAFETRVKSDKTVFVGLTISPEIDKLTSIGQAVLDALCSHSETGNLVMLDIAHRETALARFINVLGQSGNHDAILVVARKDGLSGPIIKELGLQKELSRLARKFELPDDHQLLKTMYEQGGTA